MLEDVERSRTDCTYFSKITTTLQYLTVADKDAWLHHLVVKEKAWCFVLLYLLVYSIWIYSHSFSLCQSLHTARCHSHCQTATSARIYGYHAALSLLRADGWAEGQQIARGQRRPCGGKRECGGYRDTLHSQVWERCLL